MDSITQLTLGAAVGEATLGRQLGRRAALWGAILGTLPDLDSFIPLGDPVRSFTYHRGFSHSVFFLTAIAPLLAWLIWRIHRKREMPWRRFLWMTWLCLVTHPILDAFTIYGTQIFWPLDKAPVGRGSIFIIDPFYTLPLALGVLAGLVLRDRATGLKLNLVGLGFSTFYLLWTVVVQAHVYRVVDRAIAAQGIPAEARLAIPAPFNSILWRTVVLEDGAFREGFYSLFDGSADIRFQRFPNDRSLLANLEDDWAVKRLAWFSKGFFSVREEADQVIVTDLRMGQDPFYAFAFVVGERRDGRIVPVPNRYFATPRPPPGALRWILRRALGSTAVVPPARMN